MKNLLLLAVTGAMAVSGMHAQTLTTANKLSRISKTHLQASTTPSAQAVQAKAAAKKSAFYSRPAGALFWNSDKMGQMYGFSCMYVPADKDVVFAKNAPSGADLFWHQNTYDWYDEVTTYDRTGQKSDQFYTDEDGNFHLQLGMNYTDALPTLVCGTDSFTLSEENPYFVAHSDDNPYGYLFYYPRMYSGMNKANQVIQPLAYTDDHVSSVYYGALSTEYVYGTGTVTVDGTTYTGTGVYQVFEKPMQALWVEDVFLNGLSRTAGVAKGDSLKMYITNVVTDQSGEQVPGDEVLAELTAVRTNAYGLGAVSFDDNTTGNALSLTFKPVAPSSAVKGFLIDQPFAVTVKGFDHTGVDFGVAACDMPYSYTTLSTAKGIFTDGSGREVAADIYTSNNIALQVVFTSKYDYCNGYEDYAKVKVSDDGNSCTNYKYSEFNGAVVLTNGDWKDAEGNDNYTITGLPSWIKKVTVDETTLADYGLLLLYVTAEPLPEGVTGRQCELNLVGKGYTSTNPVEVLQGDATPNAIENVTVRPVAADGKLYNVAGQRVDANYKGIVIQNGKKYLNK